jgi:hypothetical protein
VKSTLQVSGSALQFVSTGVGWTAARCRGQLPPAARCLAGTRIWLAPTAPPPGCASLSPPAPPSVSTRALPPQPTGPKARPSIASAIRGLKKRVMPSKRKIRAKPRCPQNSAVWANVGQTVRRRLQESARHSPEGHSPSIGPTPEIALPPAAPATPAANKPPRRPAQEQCLGQSRMFIRRTCRTDIRRQQRGLPLRAAERD